DREEERRERRAANFQGSKPAERQLRASVVARRKNDRDSGSATKPGRAGRTGPSQRGHRKDHELCGVEQEFLRTVVEAVWARTKHSLPGFRLRFTAIAIGVHDISGGRIPAADARHE